MKILLLGLVIIGFGLMFWVIRLCRGMRAEYRPPFGLAGPFWFLRLDYYSDKGKASVAKAACALALLSFVFVGLSMAFSALLPPGQGFGPRGKELPPEISGTIPAVVFFNCALLATIGLLLAAAFQLGTSWLRPSRDALRQSARRLAIYGAGALLVALGHLTLMRVAPALLK